jgi:hypothetical protein
MRWPGGLLSDRLATFLNSHPNELAVPSRITPDEYSDTTSLKWCTHCGEQKPLFEFHADANNADGLKNQCKECRARIHADNEESQIDPRIIAIEEEALEKLGQLSAGGTTNPHTEDVIDSFMRFTGGIDGFIRRINANYYACKPGSQQRTKIDLALMSLIASQEKDKGALGKMTQAELQKLYVQTVGQLRVNAPQLIDVTPTSTVTEAVPHE